MIVDTSSSSSSSSSSSWACFLFSFFLSGGIFSNRASERRSQQQLLHHKQGQLGSIPPIPKGLILEGSAQREEKHTTDGFGATKVALFEESLVLHHRGSWPAPRGITDTHFLLILGFPSFILSYSYSLSLVFGLLCLCTEREQAGSQALVVVEGEGEVEAVRNWQLRSPCFADLLCCWGLHFEAGNLDNKGHFANKVVCFSSFIIFLVWVGG